VELGPLNTLYYITPKTLSIVDIAQINAIGFHFNIHLLDNKVFSTTIYKINLLIKEREALAIKDQETVDLIRTKLLAAYRDFIDVFSKAGLDILPPHYLYDHKIYLESNVLLSYSPLYNQSIDKLRITKQYLVDNLGKGFIVLSRALYASPILFVKKPSGGLRFYINFRKLNTLTRKDRYPLPLINKTLARISQAKIFTKLNIRQAFYRIRIDPSSKDLTTFYTQYGVYKYKVLLFGLTNGPATYQRYINNVLFNYLDVFYIAYLDNILIYSSNKLEHKEHIKKVLIRLREAGL
jgi:hypothetical protein